MIQKNSVGFILAVAGAAAAVNAGDRVRYAQPVEGRVKSVEQQARKFYFNATTGERIIYTDSVSHPRVAEEDQWLNIESDPCDDGGFYTDVVEPAGIAAFPEVELAPAVGMQGDVQFDTLVDQIEISFTTEFSGATTTDNNLVVAIMEGDDGFGDTVAQPLITIGVTDLPGAGTDTFALFTGTVDLGDGFEMGDTDDNPVTRDLNGTIADPTATIYNALGGDAGDPSILDRDPVFFGPGNGPGDGMLDFSVRFWFEQPGVVLGDESTYGNLINQGMLLAGPPQLDDGSGVGYDDCSQLIGNYTLPGPLALYDNTDYYGFDGGLSGTGGADPLAPFGANYDISLWFGGSCCFPGVDPNDPVTGRAPMATFYFGLRGPVQFEYDDSGTGGCAPDLTGDTVLNIDDVLAFLNAFAASDDAADFTDDGVFNIDDVLAFLNAFAAGCP